MVYHTDTCTMELSVRELCERAHKSGSLDTGRPRRSPEKLNAGAALHRELQKKGRENYQAEVPLCNTTTCHGITYTVEGRADGVLNENGKWIVEEIKTTDGGRLSAPRRTDAYSQLRCYAYFLTEIKELAEVTLRLRMIDRKTGKEEKTDSVARREDLSLFYLSLLTRIEPFAKLEVLRREELIPSTLSVSFPYPHPREGQAELAEATFRAIRRKKTLFAQAPTGIGKTMATLYPAIKALGEGYCDRVFYLTAKQSVRREAYAAAGKLFARGARLRTVILYAKEQMCLCEEGCRAGNRSHCNPGDCIYARGYYDRADDAVLELLSRQNGFPRSILLEVARKHRVCPYELSLDLSEQCEIIICDYNYVFDPFVYLRRYFDEDGERGRYVFLIDEAHNLPDRARDMYSAKLECGAFEALYAKVSADEEPDLEVMLGGFIMTMRRLSKLCKENRNKSVDGSENGYYLNHAPLENFAKEAAKFKEAADAFLKAKPEHPHAAELYRLFVDVRKYLLINEYFDERFLTYLQLFRGEFTVQTYCLDPSGVLKSALGRAVSSVLFSATLTPPDYFADLCGCAANAETVELPSPYAPENLCVTVVPGVDTTMENRAKSYRKVATLIAATVSAKAGNYLVFFPSYDYLEEVQKRFAEKYPRVECIVQQKNMNPRQRDEFLARFKEDEGRLRIGFCVLGGGFSEGVDLPGKRLIGAIVIGVGLPGLSNERNFLRDYFEIKREHGYEYAYTYPGMNRVLQAAGRVIRTEEDRGVLVLIDSRYAAEPYLHLYPSHWQNICAAGDAPSLARRVQLFWQETERKYK